MWRGAARSSAVFSHAERRSRARPGGEGDGRGGVPTAWSKLRTLPTARRRTTARRPATARRSAEWPPAPRRARPPPACPCCPAGARRRPSPEHVGHHLAHHVSPLTREPRLFPVTMATRAMARRRRRRRCRRRRWPARRRVPRASSASRPCRRQRGRAACACALRRRRAGPAEFVAVTRHDHRHSSWDFAAHDVAGVPEPRHARTRARRPPTARRGGR